MDRFASFGTWLDGHRQNAAILVGAVLGIFLLGFVTVEVLTP